MRQTWHSFPPTVRKGHHPRDKRIQLIYQIAGMTLPGVNIAFSIFLFLVHSRMPVLSVIIFSYCCLTLFPTRSLSE